MVETALDLGNRLRRRGGGVVPVPLRGIGVNHGFGIMYLIVVPAMIFSVLGYVLVSDHQTNQEVRRAAALGQQAHDVQCVLKHDLEVRLEAGLDFLKEHPSGIPGFPLAVIASSINNEKATLAALSGLNCKE